MKQSNQYVIVNVKDIQGEFLNGIDGQDALNGGLGNDTFQGNGGNDTSEGGSDFDIAIYTGNFADYVFSISNKIVTVTDNRSSTNDGTDQLSNIEKITFADKNALVTSKEIKPIDALGFQSEKVYSGKSDTYKFYDLGSDKYGVATFDQVTGLDTDSGKMFRL